MEKKNARKKRKWFILHILHIGYSYNIFMFTPNTTYLPITARPVKLLTPLPLAEEEAPLNIQNLSA